MSKNTRKREELTIPVCFFNYINGVYDYALNGEKNPEKCYKHIADMVMSVIGPNFDPSMDIQDGMDDPMAVEYAAMAGEMINLLNK